MNIDLKDVLLVILGAILGSRWVGHAVAQPFVRAWQRVDASQVQPRMARRRERAAARSAYEAERAKRWASDPQAMQLDLFQAVMHTLTSIVLLVCLLALIPIAVRIGDVLGQGLASVILGGAMVRLYVTLDDVAMAHRVMGRTRKLRLEAISDDDPPA